MPDNKKHKDPQVDKFVKDHPEYEPFFQSNPIPESKISENPKFEDYNNFVDRNEGYLRDKSELYNFGQKLNTELEKKNPKLYKDLMSKYGWDESKPLSPKTRVTGAEKFAEKNPDFYLSPDEQKKVLGEDWDKYVGLRGKYGKDLQLIGEGDDPNKPETWKAGARHSVAFNPASSTLTVEPAETNKQYKDTSTFKRVEKYNPESEDKYTGYTMYSNINPEDPSKNTPQTYVRRLSKVISGYDPSTTKNTDEGVVFKDPGWNFYKVYDDGTREPIDESSYKTMKQFNNLPQHIKNKYVEELDPSTLEGENKKIADQKMSVLKNK
jgi:hypothetical protein